MVVALNVEEGKCREEVMNINQVEAKDFLEVQRSSFDILQTLQWTGWLRKYEEKKRNI